MPLEIVRNDITKMQVDAIVNTANPKPIVGGGVDRAIHRAAGAELLAARKKIGAIATGKAEVTPAYGLHAKFVIHTVGPVWQDGGHGERELLADCYANSLKLAAENGCSSIAFPLISAGVFGCPSEIAIAVATQAQYVNSSMTMRWRYTLWCLTIRRSKSPAACLRMYKAIWMRDM